MYTCPITSACNQIHRWVKHYAHNSSFSSPPPQLLQQLSLLS
jgi:hypothetical protein